MQDDRSISSRRNKCSLGIVCKMHKLRRSVNTVLAELTHEAGLMFEVDVVS